VGIARRLLGLIGKGSRVLWGVIADILLCNLGVSDSRLCVHCFFAMVKGECVTSAVGVDRFFWRSL
jgi:hypothetical protein